MDGRWVSNTSIFQLYRTKVFWCSHHFEQLVRLKLGNFYRQQTVGITFVSLFTVADRSGYVMREMGRTARHQHFKVINLKQLRFDKLARSMDIRSVNITMRFSFIGFHILNNIYDAYFQLKLIDWVFD